jgi:hypothetical protein
MKTKKKGKKNMQKLGSAVSAGMEENNVSWFWDSKKYKKIICLPKEIINFDICKSQNFSEEKQKTIVCGQKVVQQKSQVCAQNHQQKNIYWHCMISVLKILPVREKADFVC